MREDEPNPAKIAVVMPALNAVRTLRSTPAEIPSDTLIAVGAAPGGRTQ